MVSLYKPKRMPLLQKTRVEILGVFGAGKTTLLEKLSDDFIPLRESHESMPFWKNSEYREALGYLPYDVSFLMHHLELVVFEKSPKLMVCDWSFKTDLLWASLRLEDQFYAYNRLHRSITSRLENPVAYIYLNYPPELIQDRIIERGRTEERAIDIAQIRRAASALNTSIRGTATKVLEIGPETSIGYIKEQLFALEKVR